MMPFFSVFFIYGFIFLYKYHEKNEKTLHLNNIYYVVRKNSTFFLPTLKTKNEKDKKHKNISRITSDTKKLL
jgi:hypothetical protein